MLIRFQREPSVELIRRNGLYSLKRTKYSHLARDVAISHIFVNKPKAQVAYNHANLLWPTLQILARLREKYTALQKIMSYMDLTEIMELN